MNSHYIKFRDYFIFILITIFSCDDPNYPEDIWDGDDTGGETPVITNVEPSGGAFAGIDTVTITGQNFSDTETKNIVYFNSLLGKVVDAT